MTHLKLRQDDFNIGNKFVQRSHIPTSRSHEIKELPMTFPINNNATILENTNEFHTCLPTTKDPNYPSTISQNFLPPNSSSPSTDTPGNLNKHMSLLSPARRQDMFKQPKKMQVFVFTLLFIIYILSLYLF